MVENVLEEEIMERLPFPKERAVGFQAGRRAREVVCRAGVCWVTQEGDAADHVLRAGETLPLRPRGRVVVFDVHDAEVAVRGRPVCADGGRR